jgi:multidrug resistance efflux pump
VHGDDPNNRGGTYTYIFVNMSYQADLENAEKDLAGPKQMQVIASKDAEIEDLKERLVAAEKQLDEEQANLKKTKVCERVQGGMI